MWPLMHLRPLHRMRLMEGVKQFPRASLVSLEWWQQSDDFNLHPFPIAKQLSSTLREEARIIAGEEQTNFQGFLNNKPVIYCEIKRKKNQGNFVVCGYSPQEIAWGKEEEGGEMHPPPNGEL